MTDVKAPSAASDIALWTGVLGAPAMWGLQLQIGYSMAPLMCGLGTRLPLYLLTGVCLVLALFGAFLSLRQWHRAGGGSPDETEGGPVARRRFLGALGAIVGLTFAIVILAQGLVNLFFDPCWS